MASKGSRTASAYLASALQNPSAMGLAVLLVLIVVNLALQPALFTRDILTSNLMSFTPLIFAALAQGIIILSGSVDMSIGAVMSFYTIVCASTMSDTNVWWVVLLGLAISIGIGGFNGLLIGTLRLPPFITTFATSGIVLGVTILIMPVPAAMCRASSTRSTEAPSWESSRCLLRSSLPGSWSGR